MKQRYEHQIKICDTYKEDKIIAEEQKQGWELVAVRGLSTMGGSFSQMYFKRPVEKEDGRK